MALIGTGGSGGGAGHGPVESDSVFGPLHELPATERAVFIDKDGTLVENVPYNVDPAKLKLTPNAADGLRTLQAAGFKLIVITNQPGIAFGMFTRSQLAQLHAALASMLAQEGVRLDDFFACPHAPATDRLGPGCLCRKPAPGLLRQAAKTHRIDLAASWMVGDILDDVEAGHRAGCRSLLMDVGNETVWRMSPMRTPEARVPDLLAAARHIAEAEARGPRRPRRADDASPAADHEGGLASARRTLPVRPRPPLGRLAQPFPR